MKIIVVSEQQICEYDLVSLLRPLKKYHMPYAMVRTPTGYVLIRKPMDYELGNSEYKSIIIDHDKSCYDLSGWDGKWKGGS